MTGDRKPSGSNICATSERTRRFVNLEFEFDLAENEKLSSVTFHCKPRILVLQSSSEIIES